MTSSRSILFPSADQLETASKITSLLAHKDILLASLSSVFVPSLNTVLMPVAPYPTLLFAEAVSPAPGLGTAFLTEQRF